MPLLCGCKRHEGMSDRINRNTLKLCKCWSKWMHLSHRWSRKYSLLTLLKGEGWQECWAEFELLNAELYLPKKKADKVGLTRSPQAEFFGFWSRRGPVSPMIRAPTGAVRRMASTATVSTSMPYFCSCLSSFVLAMSKAVEPMAAWWRQEHWCHSQMTFTSTTRGKLKEIEKNILVPALFMCMLQKKQYLQIPITKMTWLDKTKTKHKVKISAHVPALWLWASTLGLWTLSPSC